MVNKIHKEGVKALLFYMFKVLKPRGGMPPMGVNFLSAGGSYQLSLHSTTAQISVLSFRACTAGEEPHIPKLYPDKAIGAEATSARRIHNK